MVSVAGKCLLRAHGDKSRRSGEQREGDQHAAKNFSHVLTSFEEAHSSMARPGFDVSPLTFA